MPVVITSISPRKATRGESGDLITITGTGLGASQGTGGVTIGAVAAIIDTWSATSITCYADDSPATPLGSQDVVVTEDGVTPTTDTETDGVYVYDGTDENNTAELDTGSMADQAVFIDGLHVGYLDGDVSIVPDEMRLDFTPNCRSLPVHREVLTRTEQLSMTLRQINGVNLALALGGTYTVGVLTLDVSGTRSLTDKSVMIVDKTGRGYYMPRCLLLAPSGLTLTPDEWIALPLTLTVLPPSSDDTGLLYRMVLPS